MNENQASSPGIHYVCIATAQNSVNILPLFTDTRYQLKNNKKVTILTSEKGKVKLWTDLLEAFIKDLSKEPIIVNRLMMADYNTAGHLLAENLKGENEVVINIGGGVKAIALSIWTYALENKWERGWEVIYPNIEENKMDLFSKAGHYSENLAADVHLKHILKLYNFTLFNDPVHSDDIGITNHFKDPNFRIAFYRFLNYSGQQHEDVPEIENKTGSLPSDQMTIMNKILKQIKEDLTSKLKEASDAYHQKVKESWSEYKVEMIDVIRKKYPGATFASRNFESAKIDLQPLLPPAFSKKTIERYLKLTNDDNFQLREAYHHFEVLNPPQYFEKIIQSEVAKFIQSHPKTKLLEYFINIEVTTNGQSAAEAEHDILLNLHNAVLISLDAKTFASDAKDLLSRIKRLENLAGIYTRFVIIIPYFWEDFTSENLDAIEYLKKLYTLPFFFDTHHISFCVYNHNAESFYITQTDNGIIRSSEPTSIPYLKSIKIQHYTHFLNQVLTISPEKNK
ncbi:MAG: DUF1887 family protein [Saprospiraceae bacterium]|nr:DUF1887 family protein [Saprospiraceae bacterium]